MPRLCRYSTNRSRGERATGTCPKDSVSPMKQPRRVHEVGRPKCTFSAAGALRFAYAPYALIETIAADERAELQQISKIEGRVCINKIVRGRPCAARRCSCEGLARPMSYTALRNLIDQSAKCGVELFGRFVGARRDLSAN
jgi:hypothetical protein